MVNLTSIAVVLEGHLLPLSVCLNAAYECCAGQGCTPLCDKATGPPSLVWSHLVLPLCGPCMRACASCRKVRNACIAACWG